ncbi:hypothetical protein NX059_012434 [Plenodomus lindquistii]|nr:hypothetical protein NX059_012434 [Plenodomus lindquistii]
MPEEGRADAAESGARRLDERRRGREDPWEGREGLLVQHSASRRAMANSKTRAKIVKYCARYYTKLMIDVTPKCGLQVIYGDTDPIFVHVNSPTEEECYNAGARVAENIVKANKGTLFVNVGADIKGNYQSIEIISKKKYTAIDWNLLLETKGLAIVKKDTMPVAKHALSVAMIFLNRPGSDENKVGKLVKGLGPVFRALEIKMSGQPHYVYMDNSSARSNVFIGTAAISTDVKKR